MKRTLGAILNPQGTCTFTVWAPYCTHLELELISTDASCTRVAMHALEHGYFSILVDKVNPGTAYYYVAEDKKLPDLASNYQPKGVFGPSEVIQCHKPAPWNSIPLSAYIIYELHVGTFTEEGTFTAIIKHLDELQNLGITALEIMPVAQFSGTRNWGYDGVFPYAVQNSYGGPEGLQQLVKACHERGIAVILDVVYNHIGPEGNFFAEFGPYFTDKYHTPWGKSLNFDDQYSHQVRRYFIENALHWFNEYGIDALRLDAIHAIVDNSAYPFIEELADQTRLLSEQNNQNYFLIAESSANDPRLTRTKEQFGFGLHGQWNDEFHHALHSVLTGETFGYYEDFGTIDLFIKTYQEGFAYSGQYSPFRKQPHGLSSLSIPGERLVVFMQNHDHIGNRAFGDRITHYITPIQQKLYAALLFFSPYVPLLFMGEEYAEIAPFNYFVSHADHKLIQAVRKGRKQEFSFVQHDEELSDPQSEDTFNNSKLNHSLKKQAPHLQMWTFYQQLIALRQSKRALYHLDKNNMELDWIDNSLLIIKRSDPEKQEHLFLIANMSSEPKSVNSHITLNQWKLLLASTDKAYSQGQLIPFGVLIYEKDHQDD